MHPGMTTPREERHEQGRMERDRKYRNHGDAMPCSLDVLRMSARDMAPKKIADMRERMDESMWDDRWCARNVCEEAIDALEACRAEVAALRRRVEERSGRSSIQDPSDSDLDSVLYDVGGDTGNEFQRRLIRYGVEWARDHFAPSESASREQCDRIAQMLADNPLNRMCDADSDPSPDVVTVPREEWTIAQILANAWRRHPLTCRERDKLLTEWDALRSGEAGKKGAT